MEFLLDEMAPNWTESNVDSRIAKSVVILCIGDASFVISIERVSILLRMQIYPNWKES